MRGAPKVGNGRSADGRASGYEGNDCGIGGDGIAAGASFLARLCRGRAASRRGDIRFWKRRASRADVFVGCGFSFRIDRTNYAELALCLSWRLLRYGLFV